MFVFFFSFLQSNYLPALADNAAGFDNILFDAR